MFLGLIGFDDFNVVMTERILERDPIEEIKKAFKLFDDDNTGKVSTLACLYVTLSLDRFP